MVSASSAGQSWYGACLADLRPRDTGGNATRRAGTPVGDRRNASDKTAKNEAGLGHYQVRDYRAWYAHVTLSLLATLVLAPRRCVESSIRWSIWCPRRQHQARSCSLPTTRAPMTVTPNCRCSIAVLGQFDAYILSNVAAQRHVNRLALNEAHSSTGVNQWSLLAPGSDSSQRP